MADFSGSTFKEDDVAGSYIHRPPYASQVYRCITDQAPSTDRLLDLGCGEGKIARALASTFKQIVAVDPSGAMIELGMTLEKGQADNIDWVVAKAEDAPLKGQFDVVTFASSIHWMDPEILFSRLKNHLNTHHVLAIISGDEPFEPSWQVDWQKFLEKWVPEVTGLPLGSDAWKHTRDKHLDYVDVIETHTFVSEPFTQSIEQFILCQHSRNTFALSKLKDRVSAFREELHALLSPHASDDGHLTFKVGTRLTLAKLKDLPG